MVGHSYIVYGPLIAGMATIMYEGLPTQGFGKSHDPAIWWSLVEKYKVTAMFSAPTAGLPWKPQAIPGPGRTSAENAMMRTAIAAPLPTLRIT